MTGAITNSFRYTGREWDGETGLYYYRARYYDPGIGRFISEDPMASTGRVKFYACVSNHGVNSNDPFGLEENSVANRRRRRRMDELARAYDGSTAWSFYKKKGTFPKNSNKCNKVVYDVMTEAGAEPRIPKRPGWPAPTAIEWANPKVKIPNWRPLRDGEKPEPCDVGAYPLTTPSRHRASALYWA